MNSIPNSSEQERLNILRMVEEGKVSANEAASLLNALNQGKTSVSAENISEAPEVPVDLPDTDKPFAPPQAFQTGQSASWLRVRVTDIASGRTKVTVNLPIGLVNWGMKIGARYAPEVGDLDFNQLSQMLQESAEGKLVDVMDEEDGEHVEIFVN